MSIRNAFTAATTGTLTTVTSTMAVVSTAAESLEEISKAGLVTARGWRESIEEDQDQAKQRRRDDREAAHAEHQSAHYKRMAKAYRDLKTDPEAYALFLASTKPELRVAAE